VQLGFRFQVSAQPLEVEVAILKAICQPGDHLRDGSWSFHRKKET
jgi:hypothetical protein